MPGALRRNNSESMYRSDRRPELARSLVRTVAASSKVILEVGSRLSRLSSDNTQNMQASGRPRSGVALALPNPARLAPYTSVLRFGDFSMTRANVPTHALLR